MPVGLLGEKSGEECLAFPPSPLTGCQSDTQMTAQGCQKQPKVLGASPQQIDVLLSS